MATTTTKKSKNNDNKKKKHFAVFESESGDEYSFTFLGSKPKTDAEWRKLFAIHINNDDTNTEEGPGIAGTYLHLLKVLELK